MTTSRTEAPALPTLLTTREVATAGRVTSGTILNHVRTGKLPAHKVGGDWRIRLEDAQEFLTGLPADEQAAAIEDKVRELVAAAPPLTDAQRTRLQQLFDTVDTDAEAS
jgi:excisionase family DNA binding protein